MTVYSAVVFVDALPECFDWFEIGDNRYENQYGWIYALNGK